MFFTNLIASILIIYLAFYFVYFLYIIYCSFKGKLKEIKQRTKNQEYEQNLTLVIYAQNNENTITGLVESLKRQEYERSKYSIHVILDNCKDNSAKKLEILGGTNIHRVSHNDKPLGRSKAISWALAKIIPTEYSYGYVFMDARCEIQPDFLSNINTEFSDKSIILGKIYKPIVNNQFFASIQKYRFKFLDTLVKKGRNWAQFNNILSFKLCAIKSEVLEKITFDAESNELAEINYTLRLIKNGYSVNFSPKMYAICQQQETINSYLKNNNSKFFNRINAFWKNRQYLFSKQSNFKEKEFILYLIQPSEAVLLFSLITLYYCASAPSFILESQIAYFFINCHIFTAIIAIAVIKFSVENCIYGMVWALSSPLLLVFNSMFNINPKLIDLSKSKFHRKPLYPYYEATLTDGNREYPCKVEIIDTEGLVKLSLWFKRKKLTTGEHLRSSSALQELIDRLNEKGFSLKVCQNCGFFESDSTGRFDNKQGKCLMQVVQKTNSFPETTQVWSSCSNFIPIHARPFVQQQLEASKN